MAQILGVLLPVFGIILTVKVWTAPQVPSFVTDEKTGGLAYPLVSAVLKFVAGVTVTAITVVGGFAAAEVRFYEEPELLKSALLSFFAALVAASVATLVINAVSA